MTLRGAAPLGIDADTRAKEGFTEITTVVSAISGIFVVVWMALTAKCIVMYLVAGVLAAIVDDPKTTGKMKWR